MHYALETNSNNGGGGRGEDGASVCKWSGQKQVRGRLLTDTILITHF